MKVCAEPGCPTLTAAARCDTHRREVERRRGSRQQRGYDAAHDRTRAEWEPIVATGTVRCWRCRQLIAAGTAWDLGHDDIDRSKHKGPEHARCNRSAGGHAAHSHG